MNIIELEQKEISAVSGGEFPIGIVDAFNILGGIVGCCVAAAFVIGTPRVSSCSGRGKMVVGYLSKEYFKATLIILGFVVPANIIGATIGAIIDCKLGWNIEKSNNVVSSE